MRKGTLAAIAVALSYLIAYSVSSAFWYYYPAIGSRSFEVTGVITLVLTPAILLLLTPLNRKILDRRKAAGRDIEEEERYESDSGMISLTPKDDKK
jgi:hypothetical protein